MFKTRLKLARLSVPCFVRHPILQSQFSLFPEIIGTCGYLQGRAGAMRLTCCLSRSQHQVESSCSYRVVILASILVDCCASPLVIMSSVAPVPEAFQRLFLATDAPMGQTWLLSTHIPLTGVALH